MTSMLPAIDGKLEKYTKEVSVDSLEKALIKYRENLTDTIIGHSCQVSIFDENNVLLEEYCQL